MDDDRLERVDELIALAALGELTDDEQRELDGLADNDPMIAAELADALDAAATLHAIDEVEPPSGLKLSVMDAIAAIPQVEPPPDESEVASTAAPVEDLSELRRTRWAPMLAVAAALALLAGVGTIFVGQNSGGDRIADVAAADDAVIRQLNGDLAGTLTVIHSPGEDAIVIDGDGLALLGDDRAFVLWLIDDDGATPVQVFRPDESGDVLVRVDDVDPTDLQLGVTEEGLDGARVPTLPILATA